MSAFTPNQQRTIEAEGNVLVEAGAGAGKTRTLVERCVAWLLKGAPHSIDEILMVTFTDAAAAEMRQRIRIELTRRFEERNHDSHLAEQIALLDSAAICTLHAFCFQLVRQHFYELDLDPQMVVAPQEEARLLADETLTALLQKHYSGESEEAEAVQALIQSQGRGWERPIRHLVLQLHAYSQTLPDPDLWRQRQLAMFGEAEPVQWRSWLREALVSWRDTWVPVLCSEPAENGNAHLCAKLLRSISDCGDVNAPAMLCAILKADETWPPKKKTLFRKRLASFFEEAEFLCSLFPSPEPPASEAAKAPSMADPLTEDWNWIRSEMVTLLNLAKEFGRDFARAKRDLAVVDFHDLEQFSLRLLWNRSEDRPTPLAMHWRNKLKHVFVDEYQDINAAQDALLTALGREGKAANRFLVGDIKQSIYRFRLAMPQIFQGYASNWRSNPSQGQVIPLAENFRSHEAILNFVNAFFESLMRKELGGVNYDEQARLRFGNREGRRALTLEDDTSGSPSPRVELLLQLTGKSQVNDPKEWNVEDEEEGAMAELSSAEKEARLVGLRLRKLRAQRHPVWDDDRQAYRPADWSDMVVLLRSPKNKVESYAKEFARLAIPLQATRTGFFDTPEVLDLLNLLTLLDNPLQDVPVIGILRSPFVGMSVNELAMIRLAAKGRFWTALQRFRHRGRKVNLDEEENASAKGAEDPSRVAEAPVANQRGTQKQPATELDAIAATAWAKADLFLNRFAQWRRLARETSLSHCLDRILSDTHYLAWLETETRPEQRKANVSKLLTWVRQFDQFHRQGLFRFLRFIEAQRNAEIDHEPAPTETENAVRLMSIHQAKGLEFPVVVVADWGKAFNFSDSHEAIILDDRFGLCPLVKPPFTEQRYPSLPHWLAQRRQKREALGEEMRLLYVAMTRACQTLILAGTGSCKAAETRWTQTAPADSPLKIQQTLAARNWLDWLGPWMTAVTGTADWIAQKTGKNPLLNWKIYDEPDLRLDGTEGDFVASQEPSLLAPDADPKAVLALRQRLSWKYPFFAATQEPAKASVSILRRRINDEIFGGIRGSDPFQSHSVSQPVSRVKAELTAAEVGTAHHLFCQFVSLDRVNSLVGLEEEAERLERAGILTPGERKVLKLPSIGAFWNGATGRKIINQKSHVNRELPFTARITLADLARLPATPELEVAGDLSQSGSSESARHDSIESPVLEEEFVIVQGVVDLAVILAKEIWVLDFKTDFVEPDRWREKAKVYVPQLKLYALALGRIWRRPVTHCWLHFLTIQQTAAWTDL